MASEFGSFVRVTAALACLLWWWGSPCVAAVDKPTCPQPCECLGNIVDCTARQLTFLPENISHYSWIEQLQLNQNPGLNLTEHDLNLLPNLTVLELEELGLIQPPELGALPSLTKLSLRGNELNWAGDLSELESLRHLDLSRNQLTALPDSLPHSLRKLSLDRNRVSRLPAVGAVERLQELRLAKNLITDQTLRDSTLLRRLPALAALNLNGNQLERLPGLLFQNLTALRLLKLSRNHILQLQDGVFYGLANLRSLSLDHNNLTMVSNQWLFGLTSLEELSLRHNAVNSVLPHAWQGTTPALRSLDLSYNKLVSLHPSTLKGLTELQYLGLAHNLISTILPDTFRSAPKLLQLDLSYNDLRWTIEDAGTAYVGLSNLEQIDLSNNDIEAVQFEALKPLISLEKIDLRGNQIRTLHDNPFQLMHSVGGGSSQVMVNTSSMVCDCHLFWLHEWLQVTKLDLSGFHATCNYPPSLVGAYITGLPAEPLPCALSPRPMIQRSPQDRIVLVGADVELSCEALVGSRGGEPSLMWRRDNQPVEPYKLEKKKKVVKVDPDGGVISSVISVLHLASVTHQDAGKYQCVVRNDHGAGYSKAAVIEVQVKPYFTVLPASIQTQVGGVARLECAAEGEPAPEISLQKGGSNDFPAARERRLLVDTSGDTVFFIKPVTAEDEGMYTCTANSTAGTASATANITVSQAPYFLQPAQDATVRPGDTAVLQCEGSGRPLPHIVWLREGRAVTRSVRDPRHVTVEGGQFLIVLNVRAEDAGPYTCQLTNTYGTRRRTTHLTVFNGLLVDGQTTLGLVMMAVVVCVVVTSLVWVIIIYHTRRRRPPPASDHHSTTCFPHPDSLSAHHIFAGHETPLPTDNLLGAADALLSDEANQTRGDIVLVGPDTGSEHSTGKDSGVGDSSQRSSEDLRQLPNGVHGNGATQPPNAHHIGGALKAPGRSALMVYADQMGVSAIVRGGSSLSVATDLDVRYEDGRPRLSTFGATSATLRRPSGHRPIPVAVPCVLPIRHTSTLPHKRTSLSHKKDLIVRPVHDKKPGSDFATTAIISSDKQVVQVYDKPDTEYVDRASLASILHPNSNTRSNNPAYSQPVIPYKEPNPYSRPSNRNITSNKAVTPHNRDGLLPSPQYMSTKAIPYSVVDNNRNEELPSPQYMSTNQSVATSDSIVIHDPDSGSSHHLPLQSEDERAESPQYMPALNTLLAGNDDGVDDLSSRGSSEDIYKQQQPLNIAAHTLLSHKSDYSTPSIRYNQSSGVQITGRSPPLPPPPPPLPPAAQSLSSYRQQLHAPPPPPVGSNNSNSRPADINHVSPTQEANLREMSSPR